MMKVAHTAFEQTFSRRDTVISGFRKCGLVPWDPMAVDVTKLMPGTIYRKEADDSASVTTEEVSGQASTPAEEAEAHQVQVRQQHGQDRGSEDVENPQNSLDKRGHLGCYNEVPVTVTSQENVTTETNFVPASPLQSPRFVTVEAHDNNIDNQIANDMDTDILPAIINGTMSPIVPIPQLTEIQGMDMY